MTIEISPELEQIINAKVAAGIYQDAHEFVRDAVLRVIAEERLKKSKLDEAVAIGIEQANRGEFSSRTVQDIIANKEMQKYR
jgi:putative addiction module CopG family antidote